MSKQNNYGGMHLCQKYDVEQIKIESKWFSKRTKLLVW